MFVFIISNKMYCDHCTKQGYKINDILKNEYKWINIPGFCCMETKCLSKFEDSFTRMGYSIQFKTNFDDNTCVNVSRSSGKIDEDWTSCPKSLKKLRYSQSLGRFILYIYCIKYENKIMYDKTIPINDFLNVNPTLEISIMINKKLSLEKYSEIWNSFQKALIGLDNMKVGYYEFHNIFNIPSV